MIQRFKKFAALGLAVAVAACGDSLGVGEQAFDPDLTSQDLAAIDSTFETEAFLSLAALGNQFTVTSAPASASAELLRAASRPTAPDYETRLEAAARQIQMAYASAAAVELIPQQYRALVLKFEPGVGYVVDETQTGPANGIRFLLYAVNPVTEEIVEPLIEIGHAELLDESTETTAAVRLVVVSGGVTYVDYLVSAAGPPTAPSFSIVGFITDGEVVADFDLSIATQTNIGGTTVDIMYTIGVDARDFSVSADVSFAENESGGSITVDVSVSHGQNTVRIAGSIQDGMGTLQVFGNGELFATLTFTLTSIEVLNANGEPLSEREAQVLRELFDFVEDAFDVWENLFDPVGFLFNV